MRPIRLEMEGFTSFRQSTSIDFSKLDIFAITGPTGAGKTSIIDAIIYALYGCTPRLGKQSISNLISQGSNNLHVQLDFSSGKSIFRVARHSKWTGRKLITETRLEELEGDDWKPRADKIAQVDSIIEEIVGLDFNGFTKSVVLPQGRFDEFLKGKTVERREILSDLLQLDVYRRMMERANEIAKGHKSNADNFANLLAGEYAAATPENLDRIQEQLARLKPAIDPLLSKLQHIRELMPVAYQLREAVDDIAAAENELKQLDPVKKKAEKELAAAQHLLETSQRKLQDIEARIRTTTFNSTVRDELLAKINKCEQLQNVSDRVRELRDVLSRKSRESEKLDARYKNAQADLNTAATEREASETQLRSKKQNRDDALWKHGSPDAIKAVIDINKRRVSDQKRKSKVEIEVTRLREDRAARQANVRSLDGELINAKNELAKSKLDFEVLTQQHRAEELRQLLEEGKPCPVCEQLVEHVPAKKKHPSIRQAKQLVEQYDHEVHRLNMTKSATEGGLQELIPQLESMQREIDEVGKLIDEANDRISAVLKKVPGPDVEAELKELRQQMLTLEVEFDQTAQKADELRALESRAKEELTQLDRQLIQIRSEKTNYDAELGRLAALTIELKTLLGKDDSLSLLTAELKKQDDAKRELDTNNQLREAENKNQTTAKDAVAEASRILDRLKFQGETLEQTQSQLKSSIEVCSETLSSAFPDLDIDAAGQERDAVAQLVRNSDKLQAESEEIQRRILKHEQEINTLERQIERADQIRTKLELHRTESAVAYELAQALRADQFIDFIQREAYHRLSIDGSRHLRTLTSERYTFGFEKNEFMVRDHWNADDERPVTTLSGGESFLASLALAWALADGLSGLSHGRGRFALESLFLDEGFGTLDSETLDGVVQGVETLSTTNRLVGIISHIPELADRMPSRIYVRKAVGGSTVEC